MKNILFATFVLLTSLPSCNSGGTNTSTSSTENASAADSLRAIVKEAYVYGFPMVDAYRIQYAYFVNQNNSEFKAPVNHLYSEARVFTPRDTVIQTPNSDTPYSFAELDLRGEPMVLTVPVIEKNRYFSIQLVDEYTFNFAYIGSRTTGNNGGSFLVTGPGWKGETPKGITKVIQSETEFVMAGYRTQLFNSADIANVKKIQAGYKVQTLSAFLGKDTTVKTTPVDFIIPLSKEEERVSPQFFSVLNFILKFCPTVPSEKDLMASFAKIDVGGGMDFDTTKLSPEMKTAVRGGMSDAWAEFEEFRKNEFETGKVTAGDVFGTREYLKNNYLYRMAAAVLGIFGNSKQEAMYPAYTKDSTGQLLNGANHYTVHFNKGDLPPVSAFWSLTMYKLPSSLLYANSINRYLLNSPMLPQFKRDADGGLTLYVQHGSPGPTKESNWLPAPDGPFIVFMRLYWPKEVALDGTWKHPPMVKI
jgi:hypothetical protein